MGGCWSHYGSLSLCNNWGGAWQCRLSGCRCRLGRLDGLCWSLAPLASLASLARPSWLLWYLGLLPLASLLGPTWLATWKTSRLAAWETTLDGSWKATRILGPLVVGLAEGQPGGMIRGLLDSDRGNTHAPPGVRQRICWPGVAGASGWVAAGNMPAKGELGVPENHEKARPDLARRAGGTRSETKEICC